MINIQSTHPSMGNEDIGMFFAKLAEQVTNNQVIVVIISPSAIYSTSPQQQLFCRITPKAYSDGMAEMVENDLRTACKCAAALVSAIERYERMEYLDTKLLNSTYLYDLLNRHFGLTFKPRCFRKHRAE